MAGEFSMPTNHVITTLSQTLLHKLAMQAAASHRLTRCRCCRTRGTNGRCACGNILQVRFLAR
jgi:hypothetical protein